MSILAGRIRVVDAVVVAAGALLVMKVIAFLATPSELERGPDGLPKFARVLAYPRSEPQPRDPETTGEGARSFRCHNPVPVGEAA